MHHSSKDKTNQAQGTGQKIGQETETGSLQNE